MKHDPSGSSGSKVNYSSHGSTTSQWESVSKATLLDKNHCFPFSSEAKELLRKKGTENKEFLSAPPSCSVAAKECRRPGLSELHLQRWAPSLSKAKLVWWHSSPTRGLRKQKAVSKRAKIFPDRNAFPFSCQTLSYRCAIVTFVRNPGQRLVSPTKHIKITERIVEFVPERLWVNWAIYYLSTLSSIPDSWADSEPKFASALMNY